MRISERQVGDVVVLDLVGPLYRMESRRRGGGNRPPSRAGGHAHRRREPRARSVRGSAAAWARWSTGYSAMREAGGGMRLASLTRRIQRSPGLRSPGW